MLGAASSPAVQLYWNALCRLDDAGEISQMQQSEQKHHLRERRAAAIYVKCVRVMICHHLRKRRAAAIYVKCVRVMIYQSVVSVRSKNPPFRFFLRV